MKKALAIFTLALFIGSISVPAIANNNVALTAIELQDDDPKKKKATTSKEAKNEGCNHEKKSSDCTNEKKSESSSKCGGEK